MSGIPERQVEESTRSNDADIAYEGGLFRCGCGADYNADVAAQTYPKWHAAHKFVEECAGGEPGHRCCHACAVTCRICGCHFCPEHQEGFLKDLRLCADCGSGYAMFRERPASDVEALVRIEQRLARNRPWHADSLLDSQVDWLIERLKLAWGELEAASRAIESQAASGALAEEMEREAG